MLGLVGTGGAWVVQVATHPLERAMGVLGHIEAVMTSAALREAYNKVQPEVGAFYASIALRPKLWERLKAYAATPESATLSPTRARYLKKTMDDFRPARPVLLWAPPADGSGGSRRPAPAAAAIEPVIFRFARR